MDSGLETAGRSNCSAADLGDLAGIGLFKNQAAHGALRKIGTPPLFNDAGRGVDGAGIGHSRACSIQSAVKRHQGLAMQICLTPRHEPAHAGQ
jgi:hypothetical protein